MGLGKSSRCCQLPWFEAVCLQRCTDLKDYPTWWNLHLPAENHKHKSFGSNCDSTQLNNYKATQCKENFYYLILLAWRLENM